MLASTGELVCSHSQPFPNSFPFSSPSSSHQTRNGKDQANCAQVDRGHGSPRQGLGQGRCSESPADPSSTKLRVRRNADGRCCACCCCARGRACARPSARNSCLGASQPAGRICPARTRAIFVRLRRVFDEAALRGAASRCSRGVQDGAPLPDHGRDGSFFRCSLKSLFLFSFFPPFSSWVQLRTRRDDPCARPSSRTVSPPDSPPGLQWWGRVPEDRRSSEKPKSRL